ncbi:IucA/IucC family C-terminal-domain containing protein [Streptomyces sp. NPDC020141]|uniref:IucA/IucC family C-terminal-domain containing protein n=1 Tax=Streptomyces sp. NPDC020141 TaxID=3365065 RepID=UPI003797BDC4
MDLRELDTMGGFFALRTSGDAPGGGADGVPLAEVYAGDTGPLTRRVDLVAARHTPPERRVAASIAQLGLAARLWSVALGAAALHGRLPDLDPARLRWSPEGTTPDDLWLDLADGPRTLPATAEALRAQVQDAHLAPLAEALRRDTPVSRRLLWGNAGSALASAVRQIDAWSRDTGRGDVAERAAALAALLFRHPDLSGTVHGPGMRRNSCCLYYRAPRGGLCGDCVFDRPPGRGGA